MPKLRGNLGVMFLLIGTRAVVLASQELLEMLP